jgi:hypothetical protein
LDARGREAPRHDEAVARVVTGAAHHDHARRDDATLGEQAHDDVRGAAARVLHQGQAGDLQDFAGVLVESTHLLGRQDWSHRG